LVEVVRPVAGLALGLFLPGFALMALLRPHRPALVMEWAERLFLSVVLSIAILVLVSVPLLYGPWSVGDRGLFQGSATGAPILEAILASLTACFAIGAWLRSRRAVPFRGESPDEVAAHRKAEALARGEGSDEDVARELYG
jgi:uncharacterized membrane protein